jgi:hypothetical protein
MVLFAQNAPGQELEPPTRAPTFRRGGRASNPGTQGMAYPLPEARTHARKETT